MPVNKDQYTSRTDSEGFDFWEGQDDLVIEVKGGIIKDMQAAETPKQETKISYTMYPNDMETGQLGNSIEFYIFSPDNSHPDDRFGKPLEKARQRRVESSLNSILGEGNDTIRTVDRENQSTLRNNLAIVRDKAGLSNKINEKDSSKYSLLSEAIKLYMPSNLTFGTNINWHDSEFGMIADVLTTDFDQNAPNIMADILEKTGNRLKHKILEDTQGALFRHAINPYREILFHGLANRTFQFQFKFIPRSQAEAQSVKKIIQLFRFHSHPSIEPLTDGSAGNLLIYPSEFEIEFKHHGSTNTYIPKISTCACTNVEVSYGETMFNTNPDGNPVETTLTLSFTELEVLTKERISQNY